MYLDVGRTEYSKCRVNLKNATLSYSTTHQLPTIIQGEGNNNCFPCSINI